MRQTKGITRYLLLVAASIRRAEGETDGGILPGTRLGRHLRLHRAGSNRYLENSTADNKTEIVDKFNITLVNGTVYGGPLTFSTDLYNSAQALVESTNSSTQVNHKNTSDTIAELNNQTTGWSRHSFIDESDLDSRIVGGRAAPSDKFDYFANIYYQASRSSNEALYICGGVLIAPNIVLGAAHCAEYADVVQFGRPDLTAYDPDRVETFQIVKIITHPEYNQGTPYNYDVALFLLSGNAEVNQPLRLLDHRRSRSDYWKYKGDLTVVGHGATDATLTGMIAPQRLYTEVHVISEQECASKYTSGMITSTMMCAARAGSDACQGDSGGPLVMTSNDGHSTEDLLVGIVSWGHGCADERYPGVYTSVGVLHSWIRDTMCALSSDECICQDSKYGALVEDKRKRCGWLKRKGLCEEEDYALSCERSCGLCSSKEPDAGGYYSNNGQ